MLIKIVSVLSFLFLSISSLPAHSAVFNIPSGNVTALIAAINAANANGEENTINLEAGRYILNAVDNGFPQSPNGLPIIASTMTINGESVATTIIERDPGAPDFRIFNVASKGRLTIGESNVRGGRLSSASFSEGGAGLINFGNLTIHNSLIEQNETFNLEGGGVWNAGILKLSYTRCSRNSSLHGAACIYNKGTASIVNSSIDRSASIALLNVAPAVMTIQNSTIIRNVGDFSIVWNGGTMTIVGSTVANNIVGLFSGDGVVVNGSGTLEITNSTISGNVPVNEFFWEVPGISNSNFQGLLKLQNTIVADNGNEDCSGPVTSLGNNIVGKRGRCDINGLSTDLIGNPPPFSSFDGVDPGLAPFIDDGAPGHGRFPLLATSPAIDRGNNETCTSDPALTTDQLGTPRRGSCDIGAIEFYPVVNDLMAVGNLSTAFDATPVSGGPAGTLRITAEFTNTSNQVIVNPFTEVVDLSGGNLLLNADGGAGGIGARLKSTDMTILQPRVTSSFEFLIGLQTQEPFTFLVNMLGDG